MTCTVDLGQPTSIQSLETQFYLYQDAWIFLPQEVQWSVSQDGESFKSLPRCTPWGDALAPDARQAVVPVKLNGVDATARYVRMTLVNAGPCPEWHDAATEPSWMFVDEMVVNGKR